MRRLLLRTSILERVNGELAGLLTGDNGGERVLQDLEAANAFVMALDPGRSWFRYHHLFADLLQLELRRAEPDQVAGLHRAAAGWLAGHGYPVEAIRHAQAAQDWGLAARVLAGHWPGLYLDGQAAVIHELLAGFPAETRAADPVLTALMAADELARGSLEEAERYLALAERDPASVPVGRCGQFQVLLGIVRLLRARQRGNLEGVAVEAERLQAAAEAAGAARPGLDADLRALTMISLGRTEIWTVRHEKAYEHLQQGIALARRVGRPFLEFTGLANLGMAGIWGPSTWSAKTGGPLTPMAEHARQAIEMAEQHGWTDEPAFGVACRTLGSALAWQGRAEEAEPWIVHAERTVTAEAEPAAAVAVCYGRGVLELARGQDRDALAAFRAAEKMAGRLDTSNPVIAEARTLQMLALVRISDVEAAEQALGGLDEGAQERGDVRVATAAVRLAQDDPRAATAALVPVLDGSTPLLWPTWLVIAFLLEASARDAVGDQVVAGRALERALDLAEPDGCLLPFLLYPAPGLLERQARRRTAHAALLAEILGLLAGNKPAPPPAGPRLPVEPLSDSEIRVLRYLPTNLSMRQIGSELYVSHNTVRTHISHLYAKLGTHTRAEAVDRARALGLLAPSPLRGRPRVRADGGAGRSGRRGFPGLTPGPVRWRHRPALAPGPRRTGPRG